MFKFIIPLAYRNPCFEQGSQLIIEAAVVNKMGYQNTWLSWEAFQGEIPFLSKNGEQKFYVNIPKGECTIPSGCQMYTIIKHNTTVPDDIENPQECPPGTMVFNKLSGIIKLKNTNLPLLIKWRFSVSEKGKINTSPWSHCYKAKEIIINCKNEPLPAVIQEQRNVQESVSFAEPILLGEPTTIEEPTLICQVPEKVVVLGSNLDFVIGAANKGSQNLENILLKNTIKPIPGVELEVVSMEGAYFSSQKYAYITNDNPGVFIYHLHQIPPKTEAVRHIFLRLRYAPIGASQLETTTCLYIENREILCESYIVAVDIAPNPSTNEAKMRILNSISQEEMGMAEILSSEAERIRKVTSLANDIPSIISADNSVHDTLKNLIKYQILLEFKMNEALKMNKQ